VPISSEADTLKIALLYPNEVDVSKVKEPAERLR
jgi:hypothetical protein